jgi:hypothetical protein
LDEHDEFVFVSVTTNMSGLLWEIALLVASILVGWTKPLVLSAKKEREAAGALDAHAAFAQQRIEIITMIQM